MNLYTEKTAPGAGTPGSGKEKICKFSISRPYEDSKYFYVSPDGKTIVDEYDRQEYALAQVGLEVVNEHAPDYEENMESLLEWTFELWDKEAYEDAVSESEGGLSGMPDLHSDGKRDFPSFVQGRPVRHEHTG